MARALILPQPPLTLQVRLRQVTGSSRKPSWHILGKISCLTRETSGESLPASFVPWAFSCEEAMRGAAAAML